MLTNDPVSPLVLQAKSRAQDILHQDGIDCIVTGLRWLVFTLLLFSGLLASFSTFPNHHREVSIWLLILLAIVALFDVFRGDWFIAYLRRRYTNPRIGYVSVQPLEASSGDVPYYMKPPIFLLTIARGLWFVVFFFNMAWGLLFMILGNALLQSLKYQSNRWPRHLLILAVFVICALDVSNHKFLILGFAAVSFIFFVDGIFMLVRFLRSTANAGLTSL